MTKLIIAFRNFANAPKNLTHIGNRLFTGEACDVMRFYKKAVRTWNEARKYITGKQRPLLVCKIPFGDYSMVLH